MQRILTALIALTIALPAALAAVEPVTITTSDGVVLAGLYQAPARAGEPVAILLHGLGSTQGEWAAFAEQLAAQGCGYLSYDARGHGGSTRTTSGLTMSYRSFGAPGPGSEWEKMIGDLNAAARFLERRKNIPSSDVVLAGASLGANVALNWAAAHQNIKAVLLLSPGLNYAGITTEKPAMRCEGVPVALAAAPSDAYAWFSSRSLYGRIQQNPRVVFFEGTAGHGVQMLDGTFEKGIIAWLRK